jgi:hypothetical protein
MAMAMMMRVVGPRQPSTDEVYDRADHSDAYGMLKADRNRLEFKGG